MTLAPIVFTIIELQKYTSPFHFYRLIVFGTSFILVAGFLVRYLVIGYSAATGSPGTIYSEKELGPAWRD